jgi:hypothetical protein
VLSVLVWRGEKYFLLVWKESISILWKIEMLFWRERKGILAANNINTKHGFIHRNRSSQRLGHLLPHRRRSANNQEGQAHQDR